MGTAETSERACAAWVCGSVLVSLPILVALAFHAVPLGVPGQWVWKPLYWESFNASLCVPLSALAAFAVLLILSPRLAHCPFRAAQPITVALLGVLLQIASAYWSPAGFDSGLVELTAPGSGYFKLAQLVHRRYKVKTVADFVRRYSAIMADIRRRADEQRALPGISDAVVLLVGDPYHVTRHPPADLFVFWYSIAFFEQHEGLCSFLLRSTEGTALDSRDFFQQVHERWAGYLDTPILAAERAAVVLVSLALPVLAGTGLLVQWLLACELFGRHKALSFSLLAAWIPGGLLFTPSFDPLYGSVSALIVYLCLLGMCRSPWWLFVAAFLFWLSLLLSFLFLALGFMLFAFLLLSALTGSARGNSSRCRILNWAAAAFLSWPIIALPLVWSSLPNMASALVEELSARFAAPKPAYWQWLLYNPMELVLFWGVPVALIAAPQCVQSARSAMKRSATATDAIIVAFVMTTAFLLLSGAVPGEAGRLCLFLSPFLYVAALAWIDEPPPRLAVGALAFVLALEVTVFKRCYDLLLFIPD